MVTTVVGAGWLERVDRKCKRLNVSFKTINKNALYVRRAWMLSRMFTLRDNFPCERYYYHSVADEKYAAPCGLVD